MPDQLDGNGLQVATPAEILATLTDALKAAYGSTINLDQNSPDGQVAGIVQQAASDLRELLVDVYNGFSPDSCYGSVLDQRVAINGITRQGGTYTTTYILVTASQAQTLVGLDALPVNPSAQVYTVNDGTDQWKLAETYAFSGAGSASLLFQCDTVGLVQPVVNTIKNQTTIVLGITSVNNPTTSGTTLGQDEETDAQLKTRRAKSFAKGAKGPAEAVAAALLDLDGVLDAYVVQNDTDAPVGDVPAHSIWAIVNGGAAEDIATAIYTKKAPGCGMWGDEKYVVERPNTQSLTVLWDEGEAQDLYVKFSITPKYANLEFDNDFLKAELVAALDYKLNQAPTVGDIVVAMNTIEPNALLTSVAVSDDGQNWVEMVQTETAQQYFVLDAARITIS